MVTPPDQAVVAELEREEQRKYGHLPTAAQGGLAARAQSAMASSSPLVVSEEEERRLEEAASRAESREKLSTMPPGGPTTGNA